MFSCYDPFINANSTRLLNWQISLYAVLLNIIILIPLSLCLVSTTSSNSCGSRIHICFSMITRTLHIPASATLSHRRVLTVLAPLFVYFLLLSYVPLPYLLSSGKSDTFTLVTVRYNVLGTFILGCLSGFGSVTAAWGYFPLSCSKNRHVHHLSSTSSASITLRSLGRSQLERNSIKPSRALLLFAPIS